LTEKSARKNAFFVLFSKRRVATAAVLSTRFAYFQESFLFSKGNRQEIGRIAVFLSFYRRRVAATLPIYRGKGRKTSRAAATEAPDKRNLAKTAKKERGT
jgi:hypothetical protein